jgi:hypothetical protein
MSDQTRPNGQARPDAAQTQIKVDTPAATRHRVSVREAARLLDTTVEGVRSRIKRGSLDSIRVNGTVYVLLTPDQIDQARPDDPSQPDQTGRPDAVLERLVEEQRGMIEWLQREIERKDTLLMSLMQRVPELEAAPEPRESPETPSESDNKGESPDTHTGEPRRRWGRFFFGS